MKLTHLLSVLVSLQIATAIELDTSSKESVCAAAKLVAEGAMNYLDFSKGIGLLSDPYYWWHAGGMWGGMVDYWYFCDDDDYEDLIYESLLAQRGDDNNYIPSNQSTTEGNDDQGFWGLAVMEATERNFTNPTGDIPGWLALTQAVYNTMWARWDDSYCGGGLRWQIFTWNSGYNYKNTISTACLYNLATRLGRYTGNETYFDVADTAYEWLVTIGFLDADNGTALIYDGAEVEDNCSSITKIEWTYNYALILSGSAYAYNATGEDKWYERANDVFQGSKVFFNDSVMYERACQASGTCNNDQRIFKSFFARALGHTEALISEFSDEIHALLVTSAAAAAQTCVGGTDGMTCGLDWSYSGWDGYYGVGEQMSALEVIQNVLVSGYGSDTPYTNTTGGSSVGDADAGLSTIGETSLDSGKLDITSGDRAGAGIITAVIISVITSGSIWMVL